VITDLGFIAVSISFPGESMTQAWLCRKNVRVLAIAISESMKKAAHTPKPLHNHWNHSSAPAECRQDLG
jgi:hypothetical protein